MVTAISTRCSLSLRTRVLAPWSHGVVRKIVWPLLKKKTAEGMEEYKQAYVEAMKQRRGGKEAMGGDEDDEDFSEFDDDDAARTQRDQTVPVPA